jgi:hypothetical protein
VGFDARSLRRDAISVTTIFTVMLSPIGDKRTAFLFSTNPNGALHDAEVTQLRERVARMGRHLGWSRPRDSQKDGRPRS